MRYKKTTRQVATKVRYEIAGDNPGRDTRLDALLRGWVIRVTSGKGSTLYYKFDRYKRLLSSTSGHPHSFEPNGKPYDYTPVLDDRYDDGNIKIIEIT